MTNATFVGVLNACMVLEIFHSLTRDDSFEPHIEHCGCLVELLDWVGQLEETMA